MAEGLGLAVLGLVMCGGAALRRQHPSWKSSWAYALAGLGVTTIGLILCIIDATF